MVFSKPLNKDEIFFMKHLLLFNPKGITIDDIKSIPCNNKKLKSELLIDLISQDLFTVSETTPFSITTNSDIHFVMCEKIWSGGDEEQKEILNILNNLITSRDHRERNVESLRLSIDNLFLNYNQEINETAIELLEKYYLSLKAADNTIVTLETTKFINDVLKYECNKANLSKKFFNIALGFTYAKNYETALKFFNKALNGMCDQSDFYVYAIYYNMAVVHFNLQSYLNALEYGSKALIISESDKENCLRLCCAAYLEEFHKHLNNWPYKMFQLIELNENKIKIDDDVRQLEQQEEYQYGVDIFVKCFSKLVNNKQDNDKASEKEDNCKKGNDLDLKDICKKAIENINTGRKSDVMSDNDDKVPKNVFSDFETIPGWSKEIDTLKKEGNATSKKNNLNTLTTDELEKANYDKVKEDVERKRNKLEVENKVLHLEKAANRMKIDTNPNSIEFDTVNIKSSAACDHDGSRVMIETTNKLLKRKTSSTEQYEDENELNLMPLNNKRLLDNVQFDKLQIDNENEFNDDLNRNEFVKKKQFERDETIAETDENNDEINDAPNEKRLKLKDSNDKLRFLEKDPEKQTFGSGSTEFIDRYENSDTGDRDFTNDKSLKRKYSNLKEVNREKINERIDDNEPPPNETNTFLYNGNNLKEDHKHKDSDYRNRNKLYDENMKLFHHDEQKTPNNEKNDKKDDHVSDANVQGKQKKKKKKVQTGLNCSILHHYRNDSESPSRRKQPTKNSTDVT